MKGSKDFNLCRHRDYNVLLPESWEGDGHEIKVSYMKYSFFATQLHHRLKYYSCCTSSFRELLKRGHSQAVGACGTIYRHHAG